MKSRFFTILGPGLLMAAAAIGVSHLVQATRAGALYGMDLLLFILLAFVLKYPTFRFGHEYAHATGQHLLTGFRKQGTWAVLLCAVVVLCVMFTGFAAVVLVTSGLAVISFGLELPLGAVAAGICIFSGVCLVVGQYRWLDRVTKVLLLSLFISTLAATGLSLPLLDWQQTDIFTPDVLNRSSVLFLAALIGFMPAPFETCIWQSLWVLEKDKQHKLSRREVKLDYHVGYFSTLFTAVCFLMLGAAVMHGSGQEFSSSPAEFSAQLISIYTALLGEWTKPLIALAAGCAVAAVLGIYDPSPLVDAGWFGLPGGSLPGIQMPPGLDFWALLPAFMVVTLVGGVKNVGDSVAVQQVSWRRPKVTDFRQVQGSLNTNGLGILTTGLVGVPPTTAYASPSVSLVTLTSVASRRVGYVIGATFALSALFPKFAAVLVSIPNPVMGAYVLTATGAVFVGGIRTLIQGGLDAQKALVAATSFAVGAALANSTIFVDLLGETWGSLLDNGLVMGAVTAVLLTLFIEATSPVRQARLEADLSLAALPEIDEFLRGIAARIGWNEASAQRLCSAGEETLISLVESPDFEPGAEHRRDPDGRESPKGTARLIVIARPSNSAVEMEFLAVSDEENLEDRLAYLSEEAEGAHGLEGGEVSLRLLRHYASSVHHQKYYGLDVVTVQVRGSR